MTTDFAHIQGSPLIASVAGEGSLRVKYGNFNFQRFNTCESLIMLKNIIGSIVFTVAVLALINFIGNAMVNPANAPQAPSPVQAEVQAKVQVPVKAEPAPVIAAVSTIAGDVAAGKKTFRRKCLGCHTMGKGDPNRTGPNLWGIVGKETGIAEGYRYSTPMRALGGVWGVKELMGFIAGPRTYLPDSKMTFAGIKKEKDRLNLVAYLATLKD